MGQFGFFDANDRLEALSAKGDPLEAIDALVPWESFRKAIEAVVLTPVAEKKNNAGRKPIDAMVMFLMLGIEDAIPDGTTLWLFREKLSKAGLIATLFERFGRHLEAQGYIARGGQMIDATIVPVPKQRNTREENEAVKAGQSPADWEQ